MRWHENCLEMVCDKTRLEANVRAVNFGMWSGSKADVVIEHDGEEAPIAVCLSGLTIPSGARSEDITIEVKSFDDKQIVIGVTPPDKGVGVSVTAIFQTSGQGRLF